MRRATKAAKAKSSAARHAQAAENRRARRAAKALAAQARLLTKTFEHIRTLHRGEFPAAQRPVAAIGVVNERAIRAKHRKEALAGISLSERAERAAAKKRAKVPAEREIAAAHQRLAGERDQAQAQLDARWALLARNDPEIVLAALRESFENSEAPAAVAGLRAEEVELAILVPTPAAVPDQIPTVESGQTVLRKLTPGERDGFYREVVCGHLLAAVRTTLAAAPGLAAARVVVLRSSEADSYGRPTVDCLLAARFTREALEDVRWSETAAGRIVAETSTDLLLNPTGTAEGLQPIDVQAHPGLAALIDRVDLAALTLPTRAGRPGISWPARVTAGSGSVGHSTPWPELPRLWHAGVEWFSARSRGVRGVLIGVVVFLFMGVIGALAETEGPSTDAGSAPTVTRATITTSTTLALIETTVASPRAPEGVPAGGDDTTVVRVIDGDTIEVGGGTRVRLIGIDTPETVDPGSPVQCFGPEATRYASELMPVGTRIRLIYDVERRDRFGRTLAYVYKLDDGLFVNRALARNGFAQQATFPPNVAHAEEFRAAVAEARDANLGLWRSCQTTATPAPAAPTARVTSPPVVTTPPSTRSTVGSATPCTATVSNASPTRSSTVTVRIASDYPNSAASATAHYKTADTTNESTTDSAGAAAIPFRIASATPGYRVVIDITVAGSSRCQTSFTPIG